MLELASRTGGRAYFNTNDLQNSVREAVDDSRLTYTIGFYPPEARNDGKFHKIKIELAHHSGEDLRYRKGFFDFLPEPNDNSKRNQELHDTIFSPIEATAAVVVVRATPVPSDLNTLEVIVVVDSHQCDLDFSGRSLGRPGRFSFRAKGRAGATVCPGPQVRRTASQERQL